MRIRKYRPDDKKQVKNLIISALEEIFGKARNIEDLDNIGKDYEVFFVVEQKGEIIGTLGILRQGGDAKIRRIYVKKSERGKNIGTKLMKKALQYCKRRSKRIFLTTYPEMKAKRFYEKFGFREFRRDKKIWMERNL